MAQLIGAAQILSNMCKTKALEVHIVSSLGYSWMKHQGFSETCVPVTGRKNMGKRKSQWKGGEKNVVILRPAKASLQDEELDQIATYDHVSASCTSARFVWCQRERSEMIGEEIRKESAGDWGLSVHWWTWWTSPFLRGLGPCSQLRQSSLGPTHLPHSH